MNAWANNGGTYTVTINPVGNRIVSGAAITGSPGNLITLNGTSGVTIDGLNDGTNSLTIISTGSAYATVATIDLKGASNNTITRISVQGYGASNYGISITNSTLPASNNIISNCNVSTSVLIPNSWNCGNGIGLKGSVTLAGDNNKIVNNTITNFVYNHIKNDGKFTNTEISGNDVYNTVGTTWANAAYAAIYIATASGGGTTDVFNNKIHDILTQNNVTGALPAIYAYGQSGTTTNIYNNEITQDVTLQSFSGQDWNKNRR